MKCSWILWFMSSQSAFTSALFLLAGFSVELLESLGLLVAPEKKICMSKFGKDAYVWLYHHYIMHMNLSPTISCILLTCAFAWVLEHTSLRIDVRKHLLLENFTEFICLLYIGKYLTKWVLVLDKSLNFETSWFVGTLHLELKREQHWLRYATLILVLCVYPTTGQVF